MDLVLGRLDAGIGGHIVTVNLDILRRLALDRSFGRLVAGADLSVADGMPLVWASRIAGTPLPERVAGSSLILTLSKGAASAGRGIFLLGGAPGTAGRAAEVLRARFPGLRVAGIFCPAPGFESRPAEMREIRDRLAAAAPDIVYVALGCPKQERLIVRLRDLLPRAWWLGVGISFSYLCGHVHRGPVLMQRLGLEWLHRLLQEPGRLARRYLLEDLPFGIRLLVSSLLSRFRTGGAA